MSGPVDITLRPFGRSDFARLISWLPTEAAHIDWCAGYFRYPLDDAQLERYLESGEVPNSRAIFVAETRSGDAVGHVEISHIWPHLSSRLSRVLVAPARRRGGVGMAMVGQAISFSFDAHRVARIDVGVSQDNVAAIGCYRKLGFEPVGTWKDAMVVGANSIDVCWMTIARHDWSVRSGRST